MNNSLETPMTRRFLRGQWSTLRQAMDAMVSGDMLTYPRGVCARGRGAYNAALVSSRRLRDAYQGKRAWVVRVTPCKTCFTISHHLQP